MDYAKIHINPFYKFVFAFVSGIFIGLRHFDITYFAIGLKILMLLAVALMLSIIFLKKFHQRWVTGVLINMLFFNTGMLLVGAHSLSFKSNLFNESYALGDYYVGYLDKPIEAKENSYKAEWVITHVVKDTGMVQVAGKIVVYYPKDSVFIKNINLGQFFISNASIRKVSGPKNPHEFDYKGYLQNKQIFHQAYVSPQYDQYKLLTQKKEKLLYKAYEVQANLIGIMELYIKEFENFSVASALVLGYRNHIVDQTNDNFRGTGTMHVLSVSGLHVGIIAYFFNACFFFLRRKRFLEISRYLLVLLLLWAYAFITGMSPSVSRAVTMISLVLVGKIFNRDIPIENSIAASAFLLLIINPFFLGEVGFQLSYVAVLGIIYFYPIIQKLWTPSFSNKVVLYVAKNMWLMLCVSMAAQLATMPLSLYYFHTFPNYFLLANLLVIPLATLILYGGALLLIVYPIYAPISLFIGKGVNALLTALNTFIAYVNQLPYSVIDGLYISELQMFLLSIGIAVFFVGASLKSRSAFYTILLVLILFVLTLCVSEYRVRNQKQFIVYHANKESVIQVIIADRAYTILRLEKGQTVSDKLTYTFQNHLGYQGVNNNILIGTDQKYSDAFLSYSDGVLFFLNQKVLLLNSENTSFLENYLTNRNNSIVVLRNNAEISPENLKDNTVILDGSNKNWYYKKLLKRASPIYYTGIDGAFVLNLN